MISIECNESRSVLKNQIESLFADQPRKGHASEFTPEQQAAIGAIACENPDEESERPISQFTAREIADEAVKREVVSSISESKVRSFLKSGRYPTTSKQVLAVPGD
ncbi:MAG: helix-turn-helix domain-containing protein [Pirellula sp.]|jgi:hypothetical protein